MNLVSHVIFYPSYWLRPWRLLRGVWARASRRLRSGVLRMHASVFRAVEAAAWPTGWPAKKMA